MAKKKNDQNILLMTDSASDIADSDLLDGGIVMLPIPITIDSTGYLERVDFTTTEFYAVSYTHLVKLDCLIIRHLFSSLFCRSFFEPSLKGCAVCLPLP